MSMQWFRLYNRIVDNDKLKLLAFEDRWHFIALCALKSSGLLDESESPNFHRRIAVKLGVQVRELEEIARRLRDVELIDSDLNPVAWNELQYKTDSSTKRVQEYRKRQEKQPRNKVKRFRNVSVTAQETDTDTDIEPKGSCETDVSPVRPSEIVEAWNLVADKHSLPKVIKLTADRKRKLAARCKDSTLEEFQGALAAIERSRWLRGENDRGWKANFDFFLSPKNFVKLIEGGYE